MVKCEVVEFIDVAHALSSARNLKTLFFVHLVATKACSCMRNKKEGLEPLH